MKSFIRRLIRFFGFELRRYNPVSSESCRLMRMLSAHKVNLVLDVGANTGQFGRFLRDAGYGGRIVSFEPLCAAWEQLSEAARKDSRWEVAPRAAIGSENGEIEIHVAGNKESSSVLKMLDSHANNAPESRYVGSERVSLRRLDSLAPDYLSPDSVVFLKIDAQGYEDRILQGATGLLGRIAGMQLELSLVQLYEGQRLFDDLLAEVKERGFNLWSIRPVFIEQNSGRLLQVDATLFRR
ncbi:MAG: FkbM family methyltransferase [Candidatus Omnitrophota bacterium]